MKNKPIILLIISLLMISCDDPIYNPKPRGYYRIDLPKKQYKLLDSIYPYSFEYPSYSFIDNDKNDVKEKYWINIEMPRFKGTLHITYRQLNNNLNMLSEDSRNFVMKHIPKADNIIPITISDKKNNVYGVIYDIKGSNVASTYQFYLTDSVKNFLRGSLYFNFVPNNDSIQPVVDFIKNDIDHLIKTFKWKAISKK